jgi:hypothetical protein
MCNNRAAKIGTVPHPPSSNVLFISPSKNHPIPSTHTFHRRFLSMYRNTDHADAVGRTRRPSRASGAHKMPLFSPTRRACRLGHPSKGTIREHSIGFMLHSHLIVYIFFLCSTHTAYSSSRESSNGIFRPCSCDWNLCRRY